MESNCGSMVCSFSTNFYPLAFAFLCGSRFILQWKSSVYFLILLFTFMVIFLLAWTFSSPIWLWIYINLGLGTTFPSVGYNLLLPLLILLFKLSLTWLIGILSGWFLLSFPESIDLVIIYTQENLYFWREWLTALTNICSCVTPTTTAKAGNDSIISEAASEPAYSQPFPWNPVFGYQCFDFCSSFAPSEYFWLILG